MATTAKGTPYVESSDLVANYPAVSLALAEHIDDFGGKVLQVVRATDTTSRSTNSGSFVDVTGMSVTITPQRSTSFILLMAVFRAGIGAASNSDQRAFYQITDSSNVAISGAEATGSGNFDGTYNSPGAGPLATLNIAGYIAAASTSARTYKLRFRTQISGTTVFVENNLNTGQLYAIEVSA